MTDAQAWTAIVLLGVVSYFTRAAGVTLARWIPRTAFWERFFAALPSTLLISIAVPTFVSGRPDLMAGGLITLIVAMRKLNLVLSMAGGIATVALWRLLAG